MTRMKGRADQRITVHKSCALAAQTFMLSIAAEGFESCPMEGFDAVRVKKALNLPKMAEVNMIISCGIRKEKGVWGDRMRIPFEEVYDVFAIRVIVDTPIELEKPDYVILAAAKVGGIHANNTYRAEFIYDNLMIEANYDCSVSLFPKFRSTALLRNFDNRLCLVLLHYCTNPKLFQYLN